MTTSLWGIFKVHSKKFSAPLTDAINKCFEQDIERLTLGGCDALVEKENVKAPISVATVEKDDGDPEAL